MSFEADDFHLNFDPEVTDEQLPIRKTKYSYRFNKPAREAARRKAKLLETLDQGNKLQAIRRTVQNSDARYLRRTVQAALTAEQIGCLELETVHNVALLTGVRARDLFNRYYYPGQTATAAVNQFNIVTQLCQQEFENERPRLTAQLGSLAVFGLNKTAQLTQSDISKTMPYSLYCPITGPAAVALTAEHNQLVGNLIPASHYEPRQAENFTPLITLASIPSQQLALTIHEALNRLNRDSNLAGREILLAQPKPYYLPAA